jgi:hypothetical protein
MDAECFPIKGFAVRPFWHCTEFPNVPHLSEKNRVWLQVEMEDYEIFERPSSQGGRWFLAKKIKILQN